MMNTDRSMAVEAMQSLGWTATRAGSGRKIIWEFRRPDTGGLWDLVTCRQPNLSMQWVANTAMSYGDAEDLVREIRNCEDVWLQKRFAGIFQRRTGT
jgi:hypothetical protein